LEEDLVLMDSSIHPSEEAIPLSTAPEMAYEPAASDLALLERIDEQLRQLVPQTDWEAKSLSSFSCVSESDSSCVAALPIADGGAAPKEPALFDRFRDREMSQALLAIEDRLVDLRLGVRDAVPLGDAEIHKLLLQAAQEQAPLDSSRKVLALTSNPQGPVVVSRCFPESETLCRAREILQRLADAEEEGEEALHEAEAFLPSLEASSLPHCPESPETAGPFLERLEQLSGEAERIYQHRSKAQELLESLLDQGRHVQDQAQTLDEEDEVDDIESTLPTLEHACPIDGPNVELAKALDLDLPDHEGAWPDSELETVLLRMHEHFGTSAVHGSAVAC
jgi:hypothetical protein